MYSANTNEGEKKYKIGVQKNGNKEKNGGPTNGEYDKGGFELLRKK